MTFFSPIFMAKISDNLSLIIDQVFQIFPFFYLIFRIFTMLNVVCDPFLTRKKLFYSSRTFPRIRQHYFTKYWGGRMHEPSPHFKFGEPSPQSPLGLRPCLYALYEVESQRNDLCTLYINSEAREGYVFSSLSYVGLT